jgi:hypothetical protein
MLTGAMLATLSILLSEYGLQWRKEALAGFGTLWRGRRGLYRALFWAVVWLLAGRSRGGLVMAGAGFILAELGALALRAALRRDLAHQRLHGGPGSHLLPWVFGLLFALAWGWLGKGAWPGLGGGVNALLATALALVALGTWATVLTVSVVGLVRPAQVEKEIGPGVGAGEVIGLLERYLTFVLVLVGGLAAVGFVVAAKAAARYPRFREQAFAEYFLIGTLCSVGLALLAGLMVRAL